MKTVFISGNDTGIGKTWVIRTLLQQLVCKGARDVQAIKPVETGITDAQQSDIATATAGCPASVRGAVWHSFPLPLAPLTAAAHAGRTVSLAQLIKDWQRLPACDWRIIEGAGGLAVPIDPKGYDWADFALAIGVDCTLLVLEDRLGAINQARLLDAYARAKGLRNVGFWLNEVVPQSALVHRSNREAIQKLTTPLWAVQRSGRDVPDFLPAFNSGVLGRLWDSLRTPTPSPLHTS